MSFCFISAPYVCKYAAIPKDKKLLMVKCCMFPQQNRELRIFLHPSVTPVISSMDAMLSQPSY